MRLRILSLALVIGWTVVVGSGVGAQEAPSTTALRSRHLYASDVEATSAEIRMTETEWDYTYKFKAMDKLPVEMSLGVTHIDMDENDPLDMPSHLESRHVGLGTKFPAPWIEDDWFFMGVDIFPTLNTDAWEWESGAFRMPFRAYLILKESEDFILIGGISVRPEYDNEVLPVLGLIYNPNNRLSFNLAQEHPNITYKVDEATKLLWEFDYALEEYEITRGIQKGAVLKYREFSSGFGLRHKFRDHLEGALSAGAVFNRRLEYKDDAGPSAGETGKVAPDTAFYTGVQLTASF